MNEEQKEWLGKMARWCAYQERSRREAREKLFSLGATDAEVEMLLAELEKEKYLDDLRFACAYVRGKFRNLGWGRIKIAHGLRQSGLANAHIAQALASEIGEEEYEAKGRSLLGRKGGSGTLAGAEKAKVMRFMQQRGFEGELVLRWMKEK